MARDDGRSGVTNTNRLCTDCQRACKQTVSVEVLVCPRYVRVPRQEALFSPVTELGKSRRRGAA